MEKKVIVRGDRSGVFFGTLVRQEGKEVELKDCRKLWYWEEACAVEQLAIDGTNNPSGCKFTVFVPSMVISDMIQLIPCTDKSIKSIKGVKAWKK